MNQIKYKRILRSENSCCKGLVLVVVSGMSLSVTMLFTQKKADLYSYWNEITYFSQPLSRSGFPLFKITHNSPQH